MNVFERETVLRRLAEINEGPVVSFYADFDPQEFPTPKQRASEIESLLDSARRIVDDPASVGRDLDQIREFFAKEFDGRGVRAVAIFSAVAHDLFEVVDLPEGTERTVHVGDAPHLEPLLAGLRSEDWCILLVNRRAARILRGDPGRLTEEAEFSDDVEGQHDQGGWSQARYQRHIEKEVADHLKHTADVLFRSFNRRPFERLLVGTTPELWPNVHEALHDYLRRGLVGRFDVDVEHTTPDQVLEAARPAMEKAFAQRERELLEKLSEAIGRGNGGVAGVEPVLDAVFAKRVQTLLLEPGEHPAGVVCPKCGWLAVKGDACPFDDSPVKEVADVVEAAVEASIEQSAEVVVLQREGLGDRGPVAALLRY